MEGGFIREDPTPSSKRDKVVVVDDLPAESSVRPRVDAASHFAHPATTSGRCCECDAASNTMDEGFLRSFGLEFCLVCKYAQKLIPKTTAMVRTTRLTPA